MPPLAHSRRALLRLATTALVLVLTASAARAADPSVADFVGLPQYSQVDTSRNGKLLAARVPVNGRLNLALIDLDTRTRRILTSFTDKDVLDVDFVGNDRILIRVGPRESLANDATESLALVSVKLDGTQATLFDPAKEAVPASRPRRSMALLRRLPGSEVEVLVTANLRDPPSRDVYRVNLDTAQRTLITEDRPAGVQRYLLDRARAVRAAVTAVSGTVRVLHVRDSDKSPWREVVRYDITKPGAIVPIGFAADGRRMLVATNAKSDRMEIHYLDLQTRELRERVFGHDAGDAGADPSGGSGHLVQVSLDPDTEEVRGYVVRDEKNRVIWNTEDDRREQRLMDGFLPDTYNVGSSLRRNTLLVSAYSPQWPATWHIITVGEGKAEIDDLFASYPRLLPDKLQPVRAFTLKTRDGLALPSYYILPKGARPGHRLPTVILLDASPWSHPVPAGLDSSFREAQLLASRGYAVVMPSLRGVAGFGSRVYYAGFGALGTGMVDDLLDSATWAVGEGIADAARTCVAGTGAGGYVALMALARAPQAFKCAALSGPVSDLQSALTADSGSMSSSPTAIAYWLAMAGAESPGALPARLSRAAIASQVKQPVWIAWDPLLADAPREQATALAEALTKAGNAPQTSLVAQFDRGEAAAVRPVERAAAMLEFLDRQIGAAAPKR